MTRETTYGGPLQLTVIYKGAIGSMVIHDLQDRNNTGKRRREATLDELRLTNTDPAASCATAACLRDREGCSNTMSHSSLFLPNQWTVFSLRGMRATRTPSLNTSKRTLRVAGAALKLQEAEERRDVIHEEGNMKKIERRHIPFQSSLIIRHLMPGRWCFHHRGNQATG
jgi:hypothetical protein